MGEQAETVNLPEEIVDILRKMQDKAKKLNIDMLEVLDMTSKEHVTQSIGVLRKRSSTRCVRMWTRGFRR